MSIPEPIKIELEKLREENIWLAEHNARLSAENELLRQKVDLLVRKIFGSSSEKLDIDQLLLFESQPVKKPEGDGHAPGLALGSGNKYQISLICPIKNRSRSLLR